MGYFTPILYLLFGLQSFSINFNAQSMHGLGVGVLALMITSWLRGSLLLLSLYNILQGSHILRVLLNVFVRPNHEIKFKVTDKNLANYKTRLNIDTMFPVFGLLVITLVAVFYSIWQGSAVKSDSALIYFIWAQANIVLLGAGLIAGVSTARDRGYPRVACEVPCQFTRDGGYKGAGTIIEISEAGVGLKVNQPDHPIIFTKYEKIWLDIPSIPARVQAEVRHSGIVTGCSFPDVDTRTLWKLVNFSYCRPTRWQIPKLATEWDTLRAIWAGLYQLHPFFRRK